MIKPAFFILESQSLAELLRAADTARKAVNMKFLSCERCVNCVTAIMEGSLDDCKTAKSSIGSGHGVKSFVIEEPHEILREMLPLKTAVDITNKPF